MNHYVYLIEKKSALETEQKYYIGVRSCEGLIGEDDYMSSSKYLQEEVEKNGKESFNKIILKRFANREDALSYEIEMHKEFDVANNSIFFNRARQTSVKFAAGAGEQNHFYGKKHTEESRKLMSDILKTKDCSQKTNNLDKKFPSAGPKISEARKEWFKTNKHPRKGKIATEDEKQSWAANFKNHLRVGCEHCDKIGSIANMARWHNNNCKKKVA
jgi:hypothetical protein